MVKKKRVKKSAKKNSVNLKKNFGNTLIQKKNQALINLVWFLILFIIFLVLYFVSFKNNFVQLLFELGALITGAIAAAFLLIFIGILIYQKTHKKRK